jgi:hypothetical protein
MKNRFNKVVNTPNQLTLDINKNLRINQPSIRRIGKWREEWIASGNDHRMTFQSYKKGKCKEYHRQRYIKKKNLTLQQAPQ